MTKKTFLKSNIVAACSTACFCIMGLSGCKNETPAVVPPAQPAKVAPVVPKPVQKAVSSSARLPSQSGNQFDFSKRKDPFKPAVVIKAAPSISEESAKKSKKLDVLPIHSFDIDKFILIGIITGGKQNQAMVVDPNKKGYVLKEGMKIGNNDGIVKSITPAGVKIEEHFIDDAGKRRTREIPLTLPRKQ